MTNTNLTRVQQIQKPNKNGRGGIYLIRNFNPNLPQKWDYTMSKVPPKSNAPTQNLLDPSLKSFHFDDLPQIPRHHMLDRPHPRIIYNPTTNPMVKGTPLVKRNPTELNKKFVLNRELHPGTNTFFNDRYETQPTGNSQIIFPDLKPGEALYFEGNYTFHAVPFRKHSISIFSPGLSSNRRILTPNNLAANSPSKRVRSPKSPRSPSNSPPGKTSPSNKRASKRSSPNSPTNSSTPRKFKTAKS